MTTTQSTRVYVTHAPDGTGERLVRASHPGRARAHATRVRVASQEDLIRLMSVGLTVETAEGPDDAPEVDPRQRQLEPM